MIPPYAFGYIHSMYYDMVDSTVWRIALASRLYYYYHYYYLYLYYYYYYNYYVCYYYHYYR